MYAPLLVTLVTLVTVPTGVSPYGFRNCIQAPWDPGLFRCVQRFLTTVGAAVGDLPPNTTSLNLSVNTLHQVPPDAFAHLPRLRTLDLTHNRLDMLARGAFRGLLALAQLDLAHNHLSVLPTGVFTGLGNLSMLRLDHNPLLAVAPGCPGRAIVDNIVDAVYNSRRTVCVVSRGYLRSEWCSLEIQLASYRLFDELRDVLVLIFLEDIPEAELSAFHRMRRVLLRRTHLRWPSEPLARPLFWAKLRGALSGGDEEEEDRERKRGTTGTPREVPPQNSSFLPTVLSGECALSSEEKEEEEGVVRDEGCPDMTGIPGEIPPQKNSSVPQNHWVSSGECALGSEEEDMERGEKEEGCPGMTRTPREAPPQKSNFLPPAHCFFSGECTLHRDDDGKEGEWEEEEESSKVREQLP
ncbi:toll-like receptor 13 [Manacus vitellinus]|uniref:toll-like receptor 13 n=1 Tax=Manacus vitellinus TaxID=328815 RepID=UPI00115DDD56|nr:toll-like receptor 13 [Manacus vitellinus]